jgi:broad specificity phosphatase PhoE
VSSQTSVAQPALPRLYVIRHGETAWSLSGQHTSRTDIPLTSRGEDAASGLGQQLRRVQFSQVLTSPLQRARQTFELAKLDVAAEIEPDLAEWDYGDYEGMLSADIRNGRPGWSVFRDGCPGGELPGQISGRADRLIEHLSALVGNIALFTHGQFASVLAVRWIGLPAGEGIHFPLDPASLSILGQSHGHSEVRVIAVWNSVPESSPGGQ